jgi:hypothetical protein
MSLYTFRALNAHLQEDTLYTGSIWHCHPLREFVVMHQVGNYYIINSRCMVTEMSNSLKSVGASVQSTTGSRGVRISGSNAGYTTFRVSVKSTAYSVSPPVCHRVPSYFNWTLPVWQEPAHPDIDETAYMDAWQKYHKTACTSLPEDEHLDVRNTSKAI